MKASIKKLMATATVVVSVIVVTACDSLQYSPWQSDIDGSYTQLTSQAIGRIQRDDNEEFEPINIALVGDIHGGADAFKDTVKSINAAGDLDFTVVLGDLTDAGLRQEYLWIADLIDSLNRPVIVAIGNHDALNNGKDIYRKMFGPYNYSFIYKDIKFVVWNNNRFEFGRPDFKWLQKEVQSHDNVVVFSHQPPYSDSLTDDDERRWEDIRANPHLIASVHAHTHHYDFWLENDGLPVYTVDAAMEGAQFGLMTIEEEGTVFYHCDPWCRVAGKGDR